jgi:hypothetical protein
MLLLVTDPKLDQFERGSRKRRKRAIERLVDMSAIGADLVQRRSAQHAATGALVSRPLGLVIAVEQKGPALVECAIARNMIAKHERLEKPRRVREVPFCR